MDKTIQVNGVDVICHDDGSISKIDGRSGKLVRMFGTTEKEGYKVTGLGTPRIQFRIHRLIAKAFNADFDPSLDIDHIDGVKDNNVPQNLRSVTAMVNSHGMKKKSNGTTSSYLGVSRRGRSWRARITSEGKAEELGCYHSEIVAAQARDRRAIELGFKALNFPQASRRMRA